jgi:hypothetical protein
MGVKCESCSTPLPVDQQWKPLCSACYAASKRALPPKKPADTCQRYVVSDQHGDGCG